MLIRGSLKKLNLDTECHYSVINKKLKTSRIQYHNKDGVVKLSIFSTGIEIHLIFSKHKKSISCPFNTFIV